MHNIEYDIGKFQNETISLTDELANKFKSEWNNEVDRLHSSRMKRLAILTVLGGLIGIFIYLIFIFGVNKELSNNLFNACILGIAVNLVSNVIAFIFAKSTDKFPVSIRSKEIDLIHKFRWEYTQEIDNKLINFEESFNPKFSLDEFWRNLLVNEPSSQWAVDNDSFYAELKALVKEYFLLRSQYLEIVNDSKELAVSYFSNTQSNLEKLNTFLDELKQTAIEPSFELLEKTKDNLDIVIQNIRAIDFR